MAAVKGQPGTIAALTVPDMLDLFKRDQGEELSDDALLLG